MERATSSRGSDSEEGELVGLKDGSSVLVRPVTSDDKPLFVAGFARLGEESRYRRFLAAKKRLSEDDLAFFTELDHHGHEALGALDPTTGEGLAGARYLRDPRRPDVAEAAIAVIDDWKKRGLGKVLLERLAIRAHDEGIRHFSASLLVENRAMLALFERVGTHDRPLRRHRRGRRPPPNHSRRAIPANGRPAHRREQTARDLTEHVLIIRPRPAFLTGRGVRHCSDAAVSWAGSTAEALATSSP
jgi:GNAT superfamily N-acetyltransferase